MKDHELDTSAARAVECLLSQLTNKGHTVYVEHFYTSLPLVEELAEVNTGLEETIMESQKGMPKALTGAEIKKGEQVLNQTVFLVCCRHERCVDCRGQTHCPDGIDFQQAGE
jgi:hypothetical protein